MLLLAALSLVALAISFLSVGRLCRWAERHQLFDIPNERSSHTRPVVKGGGLAIVVLTLGNLAVFWLLDPVWPGTAFLAYLTGAGLVAIVSLFDDLKSVPNLIRFGFHGLGAIFVIFSLGHWQIITVPFLDELHLGGLGFPLAFLWIVGLTNAYNFMDGIDGIAGVQAVVAGFGWASLGWVLNMPLVSTMGALLAATSLGFLFHNWPPANIFMGDVGSAFLGYSFACLAVLSSEKAPAMACAGVLVVWPFVFDPVFTFFRRLRNGENVFSAHRSHLYQRLVVSGLSHRAVTLLYAGLAVLGVWLAVLIVMKKPWADLVALTVLPLACFGLWGFTVIRERSVSKAQGSISPEELRRD